MISHRSIFLGGILAALCFARAAIASEQTRPNILLIVADDLGYGELGIQGHSKDIPTPHIDSLAQNGIRFTNGYVSGPYCSPCRAGLLTGRYQQRFGYEFNPGPAQTADGKIGLPLEEKTIADRLKPAGYRTGFFGKSHLGYAPQFHPLKRGFDRFYGFLGGAHGYLNASADSRNPILDGNEPVAKIDYTTNAFAREAIKFIEQNNGEPWFVYLPFNAVHGPLESLEEHHQRFEKISDPKRRTFAAMLSAMDDAIGSVLSKLRELRQEENTLIFFISDNGGPTAVTTSSNGPLRGFKAQTWEGGIRVPWIVQWKGHLPAGKVDHRPVIQLDILPTSLAAAGVAIEADWKLDGVNLLPFLAEGNTKTPHEVLFWRFGPQLAIRKGDWKLVKAPGAGIVPGRAPDTVSVAGAQLYNLATDPGEQTNLAQKEPHKVQELTALWEQWDAQLSPPKWRLQNRAPGTNSRPKQRPVRKPGQPGPANQ